MWKVLYFEVEIIFFTYLYLSIFLSQKNVLCILFTKDALMGRLPALSILWETWLGNVCWPSKQHIMHNFRESKPSMSVLVSGIKFKANIALLARCALYYPNTRFHLRSCCPLTATEVEERRHKQRIETAHALCANRPYRLSKEMAKVIQKKDLHSKKLIGNSIGTESLLERHHIPKYILQDENEAAHCPSQGSLIEENVTRVILCPPVPTVEVRQAVCSSQGHFHPKPLEEVLKNLLNNQKSETKPTHIQIVLGEENGLTKGYKPRKCDYLTYIPMYGNATDIVGNNGSGTSSGSLNMISAVVIAVFRLNTLQSVSQAKATSCKSVKLLPHKPSIHALSLRSSCQWDPNFGAIVRNCYHMGVETLHIIAAKVSDGIAISRKDRAWNPRGAVGCEHKLRIEVYLYFDELAKDGSSFPMVLNTQKYENVRYHVCASMIDCLQLIENATNASFWALETDFPALTPLGDFTECQSAMESIQKRIILNEIQSVRNALHSVKRGVVLCIPEEGHLLPLPIIKKCSAILQKCLNKEITPNGTDRGLGNTLSTAIALYTIRQAIEELVNG